MTWWAWLLVAAGWPCVSLLLGVLLGTMMDQAGRAELRQRRRRRTL